MCGLLECVLLLGGRHDELQVSHAAVRTRHFFIFIFIFFLILGRRHDELQVSHAAVRTRHRIRKGSRPCRPRACILLGLKGQEREREREREIEREGREREKFLDNEIDD